MGERFLVTGALGCIGAWVIRQLVSEGVPATVLDLGGSTYRLRYLLGEEELGRVTLVEGDITDLDTVTAVVGGHAVTNVIHLAGLQVPYCRADPPLGAAVNVIGTINLFEAVKRAGTVRGPVVYASSIAAHGDPGERRVAPREPTGPASTHYGVFKRANEGNAYVYWADDGIGSIGLRPAVVYGVGRDRGVTAAPSLAMLAAARGHSFHIPFGGRSQFQLARDVAAAFVAAARTRPDGAAVLDLAGHGAHMAEVVAAIEAAAPEVAGSVTFDDVQLPYPVEVDHEALAAAIGPARPTPLAEGVAGTIARFRDLDTAGLLRGAEQAAARP